MLFAFFLKKPDFCGVIAVAVIIKSFSYYMQMPEPLTIGRSKNEGYDRQQEQVRGIE